MTHRLSVLFLHVIAMADYPLHHYRSFRNYLQNRLRRNLFLENRSVSTETKINQLYEVVTMMYKVLLYCLKQIKLYAK